MVEYRMEFVAYTFEFAIVIVVGCQYAIVEASFNDHCAVPTIATK
jgi:hypothetical protein